MGTQDGLFGKSDKQEGFIPIQTVSPEIFPNQSKTISNFA
jgi:hypothetical protein